MLFDGIKLVEGSEVQNLVVDSGPVFPSSPSEGELFYRNDGANEALYCYNGSAWMRQLNAADSLDALLLDVGTPGTYKSVTTDVKGRVIAGSNPTTLDGYGISDGQPLDADLTAISAIASNSGLLKKTAANTWTLDTNSYITANQTVTLSGDVTGSGSTNITATLTATGVAAGSYGTLTSVPTLTIDSRGRVTSASNTSIAIDTSSVTSGVFSDARISQASVTQHQASLVITESQITDGAVLARNAGNETITGTWTFSNPIVGSVTSASSATSAAVLTTPRNISASGDGVWDVSFDGSADVSSSLTLATVNSAPQTDSFRKVTVNAKGLVTATSQVGVSDITTTLGYTPVNKSGDTMNGNLVISAGMKITLADAPSVGTDAVNKNYVDSLVAGLTWKNAVKVLSASDISLTGTQTIDDVAVIDGDRVLVIGQTTASQNGIYVVAAGAWSRSADADSGSELTGLGVWVNAGTLYADSGWTCTNDSVTLGTTSITFAQFNGASGITAGIGLTKTGNTLNIGLGAGIAQLPTDEVGVDVYAGGGLMLTTDGSASSTVSTAQLALTNSGVSAGTYNSVTVDAKGRVTAGTSTVSSITIGSTSIALGATATVLSGLSSVTSAAFIGPLTGNVSGIASSATSISGGLVNQIPVQTAVNSTTFIAAPVTVGTYLGWSGSALTWSAPSVAVASTLIPFGTGSSMTTNVALSFTGSAATGFTLGVGGGVMGNGMAVNIKSTAVNSGGAGMPLNIIGAGANQNSASGGNVNIIGGACAGASSNGGGVTITAAVGAAGNVSGNISLSTGAPTGGTSGNITIGTSSVNYVVLNGTNGVLTLSSPIVNMSGGTASSSTTSGTLVVTGGVGISGALNAGTVTATTFTGALSGNAATSTTSTTAGNVTGVVAIANGGTGQTTAEAAIDALGGAAINPVTPKDGDIKIAAGPIISIYATGAYRQIFPAVYS
jgi:hypothetical protein